jgi:hypothetical protein
MSPTVHLILVLLALVLALVAAFYNPPRVALGWLAFACYMLAQVPV